MKAYIQALGHKKFNWRKVLKELIEEPSASKRYTKSRDLSLIDRSASWVTCACGNQCEIIPRTSIGAPIEFDTHVQNRDWTRALSTLEKIELRSGILIDAILKRRQKKS